MLIPREESRNQAVPTAGSNASGSLSPYLLVPGDPRPPETTGGHASFHDLLE